MGGYLQGGLIDIKPEASITDVPDVAAVRRGNALAAAMSRGYVAVSCASRGRNSDGTDGTDGVGKGNAQIIDLKAAIRFLKKNDAVIPGSSGKIVSDGTSAGGAMSALLGVSGNSEMYAKDLEEIGAADEKDDIFACVAFCPIPTTLMSGSSTATIPTRAAWASRRTGK